MNWTVFSSVFWKILCRIGIISSSYIWLNSLVKPHGPRYTHRGIPVTFCWMSFGSLYLSWNVSTSSKFSNIPCCSFTFCRICCAIPLSFLILVIYVFPFFYSWSAWLEVYPFYLSFQRTSFWCHWFLFVCFLFYWFPFVIIFFIQLTLDLVCFSFSSFFRQIMGWQTTTYRPYLALSLFLYGLWATNCFYIQRKRKGWGRVCDLQDSVWPE